MDIRSDETFLKCIEDNRVRLQNKLELLKEHPYLDNLLNDVSPAQRIYRIESFKYFLENLAKRQLYFKWPGAWKDKFDGIFVRTPIYFSETYTRASHGYNRDYFCQCWSYEEQETMWKLHSSEAEPGVVIVSTVDKVMKQIWDEKVQPIQRYVGRVEYCPIEKIRSEDFFAKVFDTFFNMICSSGRGIAQTFLFKPDLLSYENEVRFIIYKKQDGRKAADDILLPILTEPKDYIEKIIVDPRASCDFVKAVRSSLYNESWLKIEKSTKDPCEVNKISVSEYYKKADDRYGLPSQYIFRDPPVNKTRLRS